jgi:hypothetical protein
MHLSRREGVDEISTIELSAPNFSLRAEAKQFVVGETVINTTTGTVAVSSEACCEFQMRLRSDPLEVGLFRGDTHAPQRDQNYIEKHLIIFVTLIHFVVIHFQYLFLNF